jgi:hypothetical protein
LGNMPWSVLFDFFVSKRSQENPFTKPNVSA